VRDETERQRLPLAGAPHAIAIPLDRLRERAGELDRTRPLVVSCHSGLRAHVGTRLLRELGFDARNLSGAAFVRDLAQNRPQVAATTPSAPAVTATPCGPVAACGAPMPDGLGDDATPSDVANAAAHSALLLDVRSPAEFRGGRVRGAVNLPLERVEAGAVRDLLARAGCTSVLLLCASGGRARAAAGRLQGHGLTCRVVVGGTAACAQLGMPLERDAHATWSIERQVRIAAGALVVLGALLSWLVAPAFAALAAFVGAGLVFAGITDWCGLGLLLARAPWNR
jgi:rhodanese-related sulfurtransferase